MMDQATALVRRRGAQRTWDAFRLTALDGVTGAAVAARIEMTVAQPKVMSR
jgi:hypothetical protein